MFRPPADNPVESIEDLAEVECVGIALRFGIEKSFSRDIGARFVGQERDHRACIEHKDHGRDSRAVSSFFRFMNNSLDVGRCRYLPLIESTSCFLLLESDGRETSMAAGAAVNSRRCSKPKRRNASTID